MNSYLLRSFSFSFAPISTGFACCVSVVHFVTQISFLAVNLSLVFLCSHMNFVFMVAYILTIPCTFFPSVFALTLN